MSTAYQLFDALPPEEYEALKADIAERGVMVPVELDEYGNTLDGHHRRAIAEELGIDYPTVVRRFGDDEDAKAEHLLVINMKRRHLTRDQRQPFVRDLLVRGWTPERIASVTGVSYETVKRDESAIRDTEQSVTTDGLGTLANAKVHDPTESSNTEGSKPPEGRQGKDGKVRPTSYKKQEKKQSQPSVFAGSSKQAERAGEALQKIGDDAPERTLDVKRAERIAREREAEQRRSEPSEPVTQTGEVEIRHGDFREVLADLEPGSIDAIVTDPPYPHEYIDLYDDLADFASYKLAPHGVLAVMCGQYYLPEYMAMLGNKMRYRWCGAYIAQGRRTRVHAAKVGTGWKPILIFQRHGVTRDDLTFLSDDLFDAASGISSEGTDKQFHHWGQSETGTAELVERFSQPGQLVVDPFLGGGTTALVCRDLGRRFIGCDSDGAAIATSRERVA